VTRLPPGQIEQVSLDPRAVDAAGLAVAALIGSALERERLDELLASSAWAEPIRGPVLGLLLDDGPGALLLRGWTVGLAEVGPTPGEPGEGAEQSLLDRGLLAMAALLGSPFGWRSLQDGSLVQDVLPVPGSESLHLGIGSRVDLELHTESAFDEHSPSFILLSCVRNHDRTPTFVSSMAWIDPTEARLQPLFASTFGIPARGPIDANAAASNHFDHGVDSSDLQPVLYGDVSAPYLSFDTFYFERPQDPAAASALIRLEELLQERAASVQLEPGDVLLLDNRRVVHGRPSFAPRYDGTDRWLKRVCVTSDLRRSRALRCSADSAVLEI
jgi:L-asparagine oxygenase